MAFNPYIKLDGYLYKTLAKQWRPQTLRPATARQTLAGILEGTFGPRPLMKWDGLISVPHGESAPGTANGTLYGNIYTLRQSLQKAAKLTFADHTGTVYSAIALGPFDEQTLINVWNSSSNKYFVRVSLIASPN